MALAYLRTCAYKYVHDCIHIRVTGARKFRRVI